jgi:hypothetical protein
MRNYHMAPNTTGTCGGRRECRPAAAMVGVNDGQFREARCCFPRRHIACTVGGAFPLISKRVSFPM